MLAKDIIRAWKDEDFRLGLSSVQRAMLPDSPVGAIELSDEELGDAAGADWTIHICHSPIISCYTPVRLCQSS